MAHRLTPLPRERGRTRSELLRPEAPPLPSDEISQVALRLGSILDPETLFDATLTEIGGTICCEAVVLQVFDPESRRLQLVATSGFSARERRWLEQNADQWMPGTVFRSRQPVVLRDTWREQRAGLGSGQTAFLSKLRSALLVPIPFRGESLGVLGLGSSQTGAFSQEDCARVVYLAAHLGVAISNARHHQQLDRRLKAKLREAANVSQAAQSISSSLQMDTVLLKIVHGTAQAFRSARASVTLLAQERNDLFVAAISEPDSPRVGRRLSISESASGWVVSHGEPLVVSSADDFPDPALRSWLQREGIKSFAGVPLVVQGQIMGSLTVYSRSGQPFGTGDVELLQGLAAQAAIAINHARLHESVAHEKAKLEAIVESLNEGLLLAGDLGIVYVSQRFADIVGLDARALTRARIEVVWDHLVARAAAPEEAARQLGSLESGLSQLVVLALAQPSKRELELRGFDVRGTAGAAMGRGYLVRDVTQEAEVERLKASILSTVSHELRTPLTSIKGFATSLLLPEVEWSEEEKRDFIEQIDREADRLDSLVQNVLHVSRMEAGMLHLEREWTDLSEMVSGVVARMEPVVAEHSISVVQSDGKVAAFVDTRYLERVVWNLLDNAAKYSPPGSPITVHLAADHAAVEIRVQDRGAGIKQEDHERVFERFYRTPEARKVGGVGLGLAICRGIVAAHGGTIVVQSECGSGSVFTVRLPSPDGEAAR